MAHPEAPMLSAHHFSYAVDGVPLLTEIELSVAAGSRCAIIGPNGAGKSTLLKSFCRLLPPGRGELRVAGRPVASYSRRDLARWLAYVPQGGAGREDLFTVREFVLMGRYPHLSPFSVVRPADRREVDRVLDLTGMTSFAGRAVHTLSGGEQQKVMIAAALVQGSRVLLLDEPAAFLDPYQQDQVYRLLDSLPAAGVTLVEVSHDVNRAALNHDEVIALRAGRVVFSGTPRDLMRPDILKSIYGKEFILVDHPRTGQPVVVPGGPA